MTATLQEAAALLRRCIGTAEGQDGDGLYDHGMNVFKADPFSQEEADAIRKASEICDDVEEFLARLEAASEPRMKVGGER